MGMIGEDMGDWDSNTLPDFKVKRVTNSQIMRR